MMTKKREKKLINLLLLHYVLHIVVFVYIIYSKFMRDKKNSSLINDQFLHYFRNFCLTFSLITPIDCLYRVWSYDIFQETL